MCPSKRAITQTAVALTPRHVREALSQDDIYQASTFALLKPQSLVGFIGKL